ncbi:MAG: DNA recombination protein RmuC [Polaribacter sp.]|nr:DNA recombination protein RmuC [Polaribacter sp.]MDG1953659.1 DNA recombination protein RmuC [Polaribacter sp.]MDG2073462.1 DNA recombination protein RmuC [Polaribacter sp.]
MEITLQIVILIGLAGTIFYLYKTNSSKNSDTKSDDEALKMQQQLNSELRTDLQKLREEKEYLTIANTKNATENSNLKEKLELHKDETEKLQEKFTKEFENLANKILTDNSKTFKEQNKESIEGILNPLKEKIDGFEKKVAESQKESIGMHAALKEQLRGLKDLNLQMSKEAINLTKALKGDSKVQGDWGETQLEMLLEKANLTKEIHFETQGGYRDDEGKLKKPDFIINLPDDRHLIIDSKVSLTAYEAYTSSENDDEKEISLKKHLESLRKHIKDLSSKKYDALYEINTPDYVLMFVPIEPALMVALNNSNDLYLEALDKNVVLVSTSTLLATLSTVSSMWRQENQKKNVLAIAEQAGRLYDQFVNLTDDLIKVGNQLKTVQGSYDTSMKKLTGKGNLITKVERIKTLGAKTSKNLNKNLLDRANDE